MDNPAPTDVAIQLSAIAWLVLVIVVVLSFGLALLCRRRYVAAVVRLQGRSKVEPNESWSAAPTVQPLRLVAEELADGAGPDVAVGAVRLRRAILASQLASDIVFWCGFLVLCLLGPALIPAVLHAIRTGDTSVLRAVIGLLSLGFSSDLPFSPVWVTLAFGVMWLVIPPILVIATQTAVRPKHVYVPVAAVVAAWVAETMRISWLVAPIAIVVVIAAVGAAVLFLHDPRVRGAASSLIVALSVGLTAWTTITLVAVLYFEDGNQADTSFSASDILFLAAYLLVIAATSVGVLFGLARAYTRKHFSDIQLANAAFWLPTTTAAFGLGAAMSQGTSVGTMLGEVGALLVWAFGVMYVRRRWRRRLLRTAPPPTGGLLILRVFKRPVQSEELIDRLLSYWRFAAPVHFIGGPDLAGASIEPDEFFAFMRGQLAQRFVRTAPEIGAAVDRLDRERDPDSRFRVNELFCAEDTWRETIRVLMTQAGVVLLDLREYKESHVGTRYEIYQLMNVVSADRVIVLSGSAEDTDAISTELYQAWAAMVESSPNRRLVHPELQLCRMRSGSAAEVKTLFLRIHARAMNASAAPPAAAPPA